METLPTKRVLIVDDVPDILSLFRDASRRIRGYHLDVVTEANPKRAIELLGSVDFDLIVSDVRMKETDGVEVLEAARQKTPNAIRVLMTGYHTVPADLERVLRMNADAYLHKPIGVSDIVRLMRALLAREPETLRERQQHARMIERIAAISNEDVRVG